MCELSVVQWAIPFFIHTGVWTTKFLKANTSWREWNDCLTHKSPGIESFPNLIPQKKIISDCLKKIISFPPLKKIAVQIYHLEKYTLKWKPLEKVIIKGSLNFYIHTSLLWINIGIAQWVWMAPLIQNAKHLKNKDQVFPNWHIFCLFCARRDQLSITYQSNYIWNITK